MKINHKKVEIKLLVSNFMSCARRLPMEKRLFLLKMMEQTRQACRNISENSLYERGSVGQHSWELYALWERQKRGLTQAIQRGGAAMWMILDDPKKRTPEQIETRLREVDRLVSNHGFHNPYDAMPAKIEGSLFDEKHVPSGECIPEHKQKEYKNRMEEYICLSKAEREQFIAKIKCLKRQSRQVLPPQPDRQRS